MKVFQGHVQSFQLPFPYKGIDTNSQNDPTCARYVQNMVISDNQTGQVRYGTNFITFQEFDQDRPFTDTIEVMNYFKLDGTTEQIIYQLYLAEIENIANITTINPTIGAAASSTITINVTALADDQKAYLNKILFEEVYLFVSQDNPDGAYITNYSLSIDGNTITFDLPFKEDFFENDYVFFIERGSIYRKNSDDAYELLTDDLDPNVIISSVTFQNKLLIANGVNPVKIYDGNTITDLKAPISIANVGDIQINAQNLIFSVLEINAPGLQQDLQIGNALTLIRAGQNGETLSESRNITNIVFAAPVNNTVGINITLNNAPTNGVRQIIYQKLCPAFSYLAVAKKRLWALPEGRNYKDKFRPPEIAMRAYYSAKEESIDNWFSERTNQIDFIGGEPNNGGLPDNWEAIKAFGDRVIFFGRDSMQIWRGFNPTLVIPDDQFPDFFHEDTITIGLYQKRLFLEAPNNLVFLSKIGFATAKIDNLTQKVLVSYAFGLPIDHHLKNQLSAIDNEKDYRAMTAFLYPYGRFMGFKIKYSCLVYQLNDAGAWLVFTGNFTSASSFCYDPTSKDLYLATKNGVLLKYADKAENKVFEDYGLGKISWIISYNWMYLGNTWFNGWVYLSAKTLKSLTINIRFFIDQKQSTSDRISVSVKQEGTLYDTGRFNQSRYADSDTGLFRSLTRFIADFLMIDVDGLSNDLFVLDKIVLTGGTQG